MGLVLIEDLFFGSDSIGPPLRRLANEVSKVGKEAVEDEAGR